jgi:hypothetical protein
LIVRPHFDVEDYSLPPGGAVFLQGLAAGKPLSAAADDALACHPDFDLAVNLAQLFSTGVAVTASIILPKD